MQETKKFDSFTQLNRNKHMPLYTIYYKNVQFPSLSPKYLAARFIASVILLFNAFDIALGNEPSLESPEPQSSLNAPDLRCVSLTLAVYTTINR